MLLQSMSRAEIIFSNYYIKFCMDSVMNHNSSSVSAFGKKNTVITGHKYNNSCKFCTFCSRQRLNVRQSLNILY